MKSLIALAAFLTLSTAASASELAPTHVILHTVSAHSEPGYNNYNAGVGLRWNELAVGVYHNSEYRTSAYAAYTLEAPLTNKLSAGLTLGVVTGYKRAPVAPLALTSLVYSMTPTTAVRLSVAPAFKASPAVAHITLEFKL